MTGYPPGPMNNVYSVVVPRWRPRMLLVAAWLWAVQAVLLPVGVLVRELVVSANPSTGDVWPNVRYVLVLGVLAVLAAAQVWLAALMAGGRWYARLALAFIGVLLELFAVVELIGTGDVGIGYEGSAAAVAWTLLVVRVVLPPVPFVLGFLPAVNTYLGAGR